MSKIAVIFLLFVLGNLSDNNLKQVNKSVVILTPAPQVLSADIPNGLQEVKVTRVIDGDTIQLEGGQYLRYIGVDSPEMGQCNHLEAKSRNKELVEGRTVSLEQDISETDKFGRLLRYVYINEVMINELMVKEGFASVTTYPPDIKYNDLFLTAQTEYRLEDKTANCDG